MTNDPSIDSTSAESVQSNAKECSDIHSGSPGSGSVAVATGATGTQPTRSADLDDCVPFFRDSNSQITCEFIFLLVSLVIAVIVTAIVSKNASGPTRPLLFAALGGFFGGWTFDAKWFYRVTARGRNDQHAQTWQRHKFYWRILIPFVAGLISFAVYLLASSGALPIEVSNPQSGRIAFGLTFFMGLFTDVILSKIAKWTESVISTKVSDQ